MNTRGVRALVVEDEPRRRRTLVSHLRQEGYQVLEAATGLEALGVLRRGAVDIALVALSLPEIDGRELVRRVRGESTIPIIMLADGRHEELRIEALDAGADDCLSPPCSTAELTAHMRSLLRRARGFETEPTALRTGDLVLDLAERRCTIAGRVVELTRREFDVLAALLRYPARIHTRAQLLELVWGADDVLPKTVDVHVAALRRKLGSAISIATLRGVGYRLDPLSGPDAARRAG
jgi:DNA-binding response OmpR family regulator